MNITLLKRALIVSFSLLSVLTQAQNTNDLLKEAIDLQHALKENDAFEKYKQVLDVDPSNVTALVKCTEISCSTGARQKSKSEQYQYYKVAEGYAKKAVAADENNADANYAMALAAGKITHVEPEKKAVINYVRQVKIYADKALAINPNHARANYALGMWHYKILNLSWVKKTAVKTLYGGLPEAKIDSAIFYMEKCRSLDQYFALNYLDLAKAYKFNREPAKAIDVLGKLAELPNRTPDDAAIKAEGKQMLEEMQ